MKCLNFTENKNKEKKLNIINLIRKNGIFDFIIITILSNTSSFQQELIPGLLVIILNYFYNKYISQIIDNFINKEYLLIIVRL